MMLEQLIDNFQNSPSADVRRQAIDELLGNDMYNDLVIKAFSNGLLDADVGVRDACQRALLNTPDRYKTASAIAVAPYINMREIELRNLAGEVLTKLGTSSVPILLPYLKSSDFDVRKFACDILGLIADENIATYIIPLLSDTDKNVQLSAVETLGNLEAQSALDSLIMAYENFDEIKPAIIESIGKIGGDNSESYLLEQLDKETDVFLQTTIIDALSFNAKSIDISYKLLSKMVSANAEMQKVMLMTAFAIAFRLEKKLIMPDTLRYVSYRGMIENDENIMIAAVISLGNVYNSKDIEYLVKVIYKHNSDLNKQIIYNLLVYTPPDIIIEFFNIFFEYEGGTNINDEILDNITLFKDDTPTENKKAVIEAVLLHFEQNSSPSMFAMFELLYFLDIDLFNAELLKYSNETSIENKQIIEEFLKTHN